MFVIIHNYSNNNQYFWKVSGDQTLMTFDVFQTEIFKTYKSAKEKLDSLPKQNIFDWKIAEMIPKIK